MSILIVTLLAVAASAVPNPYVDNLSPKNAIVGSSLQRREVPADLAKVDSVRLLDPFPNAAKAWAKYAKVEPFSLQCPSKAPPAKIDSSDQVALVVIPTDNDDKASSVGRGAAIYKTQYKFQTTFFKAGKDPVAIMKAPGEFKPRKVPPFKDNGPGDTISGVPEQPLGPAIGLKGASGRIVKVAPKLKGSEMFMNLCDKPNVGKFVIASVESFVDVRPKTKKRPGRAIDYGAVLVYDVRNKKSVIVSSQGCEFPYRFVAEVQKKENHHLTIGKLMQKENPAIDNADPHLHLCGKSRYVLLEEAVQKAIKELEAAVKEGATPVGA